MKFLIVDDDEFNRLVLSQYLNDIAKKLEKQIEIIEAIDGSNAVEIYSNEGADFVVMDMTMPVMGGYEACEKINKINDKCPIYILSAVAKRGEIEEIMKRGLAVHHAYKTGDFDRVAQEVWNLAEKYNAL